MVYHSRRNKSEFLYIFLTINYKKTFSGIRSGSKRGQSIRSNAAEVDPEIIDQLTEKLADQLAVKLAPVGMDYDEDDEIAAFKRVSHTGRYVVLIQKITEGEMSM